MNFKNILQFLIIISISLICSIQDFRYKKIPNYIIYAGYILMLISLAFFTGIEVIFNFLSSLFLFIFYFITMKIVKNKLGFGDILFGAFSGLCLNLKFDIISVLLSVFLCFFYLILNNFITKKGIKTKTAFIPFMSLSLIISFIIMNI